MTEAKKRTRASAKAAGSRFEREIADYLAKHIDDRIDRRVKNGAKDKGDIAGIRLSPALRGGRVVLECKNTAKLTIGTFLNEAETERGNDDAIAGVVVAKRHGIGDPGSQIVLMTVRDLVSLLTGERPNDD